MSSLHVTRPVTMPDPLRVSRYGKAPEFGPRLLFFSGGSALNGLSHHLKHFTHNSIHLVTPFDSGGSSAKLRDAFDMPSIGDVRSRLMALADDAVTGHPEINRLFAYRLPMKATKADLWEELATITRGKSPMMDPVGNPMRRLIRSQLEHFQDAAPPDFDLRGASIGNLILAGGYMRNHERLDSIILLFSQLVNVRGTVRAVVNNNLHLAAELADGAIVTGQHRITGKEVQPLDQPIKRVFLSRKRDKHEPATCELRKRNAKIIAEADLIVYPPGSFYSSLIANLLPRGVGRAIAANDGPKVYVPNLGKDPEQKGLNGEKSLRTLLSYLRTSAAAKDDRNPFIDFILIDSSGKSKPASIPRGLLRSLGMKRIETPLVSDQSAPYYDPELLVAALLSLT